MNAGEEAEAGMDRVTRTAIICVALSAMMVAGLMVLQEVRHYQKQAADAAAGAAYQGESFGERAVREREMEREVQCRFIPNKLGC